MVKIRERLDQLRGEALARLPQGREHAANLGDRNRGLGLSLLASDVRSLAIYAYVADGNVTAFRSGLAEAGDLMFSLNAAFEAGDSALQGWMSMLRYRDLLDLLAAGDLEQARKCSTLLGGHPKLEKGLSRPLDIAFGYALKGLIEDLPDTEAWVAKFEGHCQSKQDNLLLGYAAMLRAILLRDANGIEPALDSVLESHKRLSRGPNGLFHDTPDELLSVWGIGLCNLARSQGLPAVPRPPLIPAELLI